MQHSRIRELAMGANHQPERIASLIRTRLHLHQFHHSPHLHQQPQYGSEVSDDSSGDSSGAPWQPGQPMPEELNQALNQMVKLLNQQNFDDPIAMQLWPSAVTFRLNLPILEELSSRLLISRAQPQAKH